MNNSKTNRYLTAVVAAAFLAGGPLHAADNAASTPPATKPAPAAKANAIGVQLGNFFKEEHKRAARRAFAQNYAKAKECPQGMEKKGKACASPWDQRYWVVGQSLQPAVTAYPVPEPVVAQLPPPPQGYEYVRVADDILLIASGTKLIMDMIEHVSS